MTREFKFEELDKADLIIDAVYKGGTKGNAGDDPLSKLLGCGNQGGFRFVGSAKDSTLRLVVLYSSLSDPNWPDFISVENGQFTYFGDNKTPGHALHDTPRYGNVILRDCFENVHRRRRNLVPPFFIFTKGKSGRDAIFRGLAVPGARELSSSDDLVAIWKTTRGERFQNYKAIFSILDVAAVPRAWIEDLEKGTPISPNCPKAWRKWVETGIITPLRSPKTIEYRSKAEQLPKDDREEKILRSICRYFEGNPYGFETCAAELFMLMDGNVISYDLTRPWLDGGRDAVGKYRIGWDENFIEVEFALEAKCYDVEHGVGVRETSRLISRLKHRQFGVFVTTSYLHHQTCREIKDDRHPIVVISARDIVGILRRAGYGTVQEVEKWLKSNFPKAT